MRWGQEVEYVTGQLKQQQLYRDLGNGYHLVQNTDPKYDKYSSRNLTINIGNKQFEIPNLFYGKQ